MISTSRLALKTMKARKGAMSVGNKDGGGDGEVAGTAVLRAVAATAAAAVVDRSTGGVESVWRILITCLVLLMLVWKLGWVLQWRTTRQRVFPAVKKSTDVFMYICRYSSSCPSPYNSVFSVRVDSSSLVICRFTSNLCDVVSLMMRVWRARLIDWVGWVWSERCLLVC